MIYLYDTSALIFSGTLAKRSKYWNNMYFPTGGLYKFFSIFFKDLNKLNEGDNIIAVMDSPKNIRKEMYPDYKGNRNRDAVISESISLQMQFLEEMLEKVGVPVLKKDGLEADDLIYSFVASHNREPILLRADDSDLRNTMLINSFCRMESVTSRGAIAPKDALTDKILYGDPTDNYEELSEVAKTYVRDWIKKVPTLIYGNIPTKEIVYEMVGNQMVSEEIYKNLFLATPKMVNLPSIPTIDIKRDEMILYLNVLAFKSFLERQMKVQRDYDSIPVRNLTIEWVAKVSPELKNYLLQDKSDYWQRNKKTNISEDLLEERIRQMNV